MSANKPSGLRPLTQKVAPRPGVPVAKTAPKPEVENLDEEEEEIEDDATDVEDVDSEEEGEVEETPAPAPAPKPKLAKPKVKATPAELKALFDNWKKKKELRAAAQEALHDAEQAESDSVQAIAERSGMVKFKYQGTMLTACSRTGKKSGNTRWYFRGQSAMDAPEIE